MYPLLSWCGGKRSLASRISKSLPSIRTYFEPFLGGGAMLAELRPVCAYVGDTNLQLVNVYKQVRRNLNDIIECIDDIVRSEDGKDYKEYYDYVRERFWYFQDNGLATAESAGIFIWLNHRCYSGMYRENKHGRFNNTSDRGGHAGWRFDVDNAREWEHYLQCNNVVIYHADFEKTLKEATCFDLVYLDPPYDKLHDGSFVRYSSNGFSRDEQERLAKAYKRLSDKNLCYVIESNSNTEWVRETYKDYTINEVASLRRVSRDIGTYRETEVIITNFDTDFFQLGKTGGQNETVF